MFSKGVRSGAPLRWIIWCDGQISWRSDFNGDGKFPLQYACPQCNISRSFVGHGWSGTIMAIVCIYLGLFKTKFRKYTLCYPYEINICYCHSWFLPSSNLIPEPTDLGAFLEFIVLWVRIHVAKCMWLLFWVTLWHIFLNICMCVCLYCNHLLISHLLIKFRDWQLVIKFPIKPANQAIDCLSVTADWYHLL